MRLTGSKLISIRSGEISRIETQLDDIKEKLRSYQMKIFSSCSSAWIKQKKKIQGINLGAGSNRQRIDSLNTDIEAKKSKLSSTR